MKITFITLLFLYFSRYNLIFIEFLVMGKNLHVGFSFVKENIFWIINILNRCFYKINCISSFCPKSFSKFKWDKEANFKRSTNLSWSYRGRVENFGLVKNKFEDFLKITLSSLNIIWIHNKNLQFFQFLHIFFNFKNDKKIRNSIFQIMRGKNKKNIFAI